MSRYWKIVGGVSFVLALLVSIFLYMLGNGGVTDAAKSNKPPTSRYITN